MPIAAIVSTSEVPPKETSGAGPRVIAANPGHRSDVEMTAWSRSKP